MTPFAQTCDVLPLSHKSTLCSATLMLSDRDNIREEASSSHILNQSDSSLSQQASQVIPPQTSKQRQTSDAEDLHSNYRHLQTKGVSTYFGHVVQMVDCI